ncbi:MAG: hypothetical protein V4514_12140 [Pseudomonadota bacterium]|uniref:hypothetical protein n=1 Tax=unclassified Phenylobacterium TaxID=2640670 RepID=UPI0006FF0B55|nr:MULTISPECIES: hypothetical protein [unclassified Phenylobacterium]KRB50520.1 hypothetical protein ASE02_15300 [Phenylobacterium sp. Root700]MBT9472264.1 hypothetical protein [Phenylobacterium sp.]
MVRSLIAILVLLAVALNAPMAMANPAPAMAATMAMSPTDQPMGDCGAPAHETCKIVCVVCHAIPNAPPRFDARPVAFTALTAESPQRMIGLNPAPETPPPRA